MTNEMIGSIVSFLYKSHILRFFVNDKRDLMQSIHLSGHLYEESELEIIGKYFKPGGIFIDVGANLGNHSIYVAKFLEPRRIICFEPYPTTAEMLKVNILLNNAGHLCDLSYLGIGLGSKLSKGVMLESMSNNIGSARLWDSPDDGTIPIIPGDLLLRETPVDFIKVDVEGMEIDVLRGLSWVIERYSPCIFVEVDNSNFEDFILWLSLVNYEIAERYKRHPPNENFLLIPKTPRDDGVR